MEDEDYLEPGRECGSCTACCVDLAITVDGLEKHAGAPCRHCTGSGCAIYDTRPPVCRGYYCLWRRLPNLGDEWRPDRSGVLMIWGDVPPGFPGRYAINLVIVGPPETIDTTAFAGLIAGFIESGTATFLDLPRGVGYLSVHALMNDLLAPAIRARDLTRVKALLRAAYAEMMARPAEPATLDHFAAGAAGAG